jgi:ABC-type transport system involved in multi-copper enzyme maturation permease subunit
MLPGPVFNSELVTTARRARYYVIRFVYGMILLFFVVEVAGPWGNRRESLWTGGEISISDMAEIGGMLFATFAGVQAAAVLILTPAIVAGVIADEKRRKTLHYLLTSRLSSAEIVLGKLFARLIHVGLFLAVGLPIMSMLSLFGGVEPLLVVMVYVGTTSTAVFLASLSLLISTVARRPREANSQVYLLMMAWLFLPTFVAWLMPTAGGRWVTLYEWVKPVNDLVRWSSPFSLVQPGAWGRLVEGAVWMVGLQAAYSACFVALSIGLLRPVFRREGEGPRRLAWLFDRQRARRFFPRPEVGDDPMLWKERYVSRTSMAVKAVSTLIAAVVVIALGYGTYQLAEPAFVEVWEYGYGSTGSYIHRLNLNMFIRFISVLLYVAWALAVASNASTGVVSEREEDTWTSLTTTPLSGEEILRAKMFGAVWATRWAGLLLVAYWATGVALGSLHPVGALAVAVETAAFIWFAAALGVTFSLTSKTSARAQAATMGVLLILNGAYLLCCIPLEPDTILIAVGVTPMIEAISLLSYQDMNWNYSGRSASNVFEGVLTCVLGVGLYGLGALALTVRVFRIFDEKIDRPRRWDGSPGRDRAIEVEKGPEGDAEIAFLDEDDAASPPI